jgi:exopolysaccharide production protein ExoZ
VAKGSEQFRGIQVLRFVAAALVVITHATLTVVERLHTPGFVVWGKGAVGVDMFFVISGFVMVVSSRTLIARADGWYVFFARRLVRIVPLYWLATSIKLLAVLFVPALALHSAIDGFHVVASYLFLPARNVEGEVAPLLAVGWTLIYEMFFYAAFALAMWARTPPVLTVAVVFAALAGAGLMFGYRSGPAVTAYANPIILEFVMGMLIARMRMSGVKVSARVAGIVLAIGVSAIVFSDQMPVRVGIVLWGLPAALIVAGIVYLEPLVGPRLPRIFLTLGDASYAIYLFHSLLVPAIGVALAKSGFRDPIVCIFVSLAASFLVGWLIYRIAEKPSTEYLKRLIPT